MLLKIEWDRLKQQKTWKKREKQLELCSAGVKWPFEKVATVGPPLFGQETGLQNPLQCHPIDTKKYALFI